MDTRFKSEQQIMECWGFKEDLETIYYASDGATEDELMNALLGTIQLMEWKFDKLFKTYEQFIKEVHDDRVHIRCRVEGGTERPPNT